MVTQPPPSLNPISSTSPTPVMRIGVGIDPSRYGHYAAFLRDDLQTAAPELAFAESGAGYQQLQQRLDAITHQHASIRFCIRLDVAGQYAENLLHFLHTRTWTNATLELSCGDPQRNKNYRVSIFGAQKSDPIEARAAARYAINERPKPGTIITPPLRMLRQVAGRLQAVVRQRTRLVNQLHQLLAQAFPELALLTKDITAVWVLELLTRYPTAVLLAQADEAKLGDIAYLPHALIPTLLQHAHTSVGSLHGPIAEGLLRDQVRQVRDVQARQKSLENTLVQAYRALPTANRLDTIPGIGDVTAAVLTAFILDIERFDTPGQLVSYFGAHPIEASSGIDREGRLRRSKRYVMAKRGNDLVRRYLWMAALSAVRFNPAVRPLYLRVIAKHPEHKAIAIGHAMRKLLHLVFALWKSGKDFDPQHFPWAGADASTNGEALKGEASRVEGLTPEVIPDATEVTPTRADTLANPLLVNATTFLDFAHLKKQLPLSKVLDQLGLTARLKGSGTQQRCACPIHRGDGRGRTFSVNLTDNVFCCHDKKCGQRGDIIDLWAALHHLGARAAAEDLVRTFGLEPHVAGTEKRNG